MLSLVPLDSQPRSEIVGPKLAIMDKSVAQLDAIAAKLVRFILCGGGIVCSILQQKLLRRVSTALDNLEALYHEAQRTKGAKWCQEEALWVSWPLEKFGVISFWRRVFLPSADPTQSSVWQTLNHRIIGPSLSSRTS